MSFLRRLFGAGPDPPPRPVDELVAGLLRPAVHLSTTDAGAGSYFGGLPELPEATAWPAKDGRPLAFLAAVDLAEVAAAERFDWLPDSGRLFFFYDTEEQAWGFDPTDAGGWRVLLVETGEALAARPSPAGLSAGLVFPRRGIDFQGVELPPSSQRREFESRDLTEAEYDAVEDYRITLLGDVPAHQVGGYPSPMQSDDMELECQLASNGVYCGDPSGYEDPRVESLEPGAADWRLLLQIDSDDDLDFMWGDAGLIYFWIREQDARQSAFDKAWLILQCG